MNLVSLVDCKKYYREEPHQKVAVKYLGSLLLNTPAGKRLQLYSDYCWLKLEPSKLEWLERQISSATLERFTRLWRTPQSRTIEYYSQRDNKILPYVSCNSSSHAMFVNYILENVLHKPGLGGDDEYVRRVYSGKYGTYGRNNSVSWNIQLNVVKSFGINARISNKGKLHLIRELEKGLICPTNFRHKGSRGRSYGGHVVVAAAHDPQKGFLLYDPYGSRMPNYSSPLEGVYWISHLEFNARWQGLFTQYIPSSSSN
jgi:hypothetical protein